MNHCEPPSYLSKILVVTFVIIIKTLAWMPDDMDLKFDIRFDDVKTDVFLGNRTYPDYFKLLFANNDYILLGGRNNLYNVSVDNLLENYDQRLEWVSLTAHSDLCYLKGKAGDACQNYIRVLARLDNDKLFICGTNSGRPRCREYIYNDTIQRYTPGAEEDGVGQCPYNPQDNTTAVYYYGHLYTATVSEFSGGDALIYRKPQRTERSDFKSLNAPNFVSSFGYGDYVFFFYRETAVEYMNCGKAIYSRVARVCKDDKGGPHQFRDRWTTFLKARLNCSIPGDYPFYFDEIQATSELISGQYGDRMDEIVYGVMTTPVNAIGGSAICAYSMKDIIRVFEGSFKGQADINANWLPVPSERVPHPRPGQCVKDSRTLSDAVVNFVKTHTLMEQAVPSYFSKPVLVQVSLKYRFTTIAVDPQVKAVDGTTYDVLYIGTDNGKLLKAVYVSEGKNQSVKATVVSNTQVFRPNSGVAVTGLKVISAKHKIVVVSKTEVRSVKMSLCTNIQNCESCVELQDPHCAWDINAARCVNMDPDTMVLNENYLQSIATLDSSRCKSLKPPRVNVNMPSVIQQKAILSAVADQEINKKSDEQLTFDVLSDNVIPDIEVPSTPVHSLIIHQGETFTLLLIAAGIFIFIIGFGCGYFVSRRFHRVSSLVDNSVTEQHNHLNRFASPHLNSASRSSFLPPRANKASNLANIPPSKNLIKKDNNLDSSKELNNSIESIDKNTLQKVKKTYI